MTESREPVRRSYTIDDFTLWDAAIHGAAGEFKSSYGVYPDELRAHPSALQRFMMRADPQSLIDGEGQTAAESEKIDGYLDVFATDEYELRCVEDESLWPVVIVLVRNAPGQPVPSEDTPPASPLGGCQTSDESPLAYRPLHVRLKILSSTCARCRWLVTVSSCAAFPSGIPLAIAQSRARHSDPIDGDGGHRFEASADPDAFIDAIKAFLVNPGRRVMRSDGLGEAVPLLDDPFIHGSDALAPELPPKPEALRRAREAVKTLLREHPAAASASKEQLCAMLQAEWPVTMAVLNATLRRYDAWKGHVMRLRARYAKDQAQGELW